MSIKKNKKSLNYFNILAIFSIFTLLGFLTVQTCSPIIKTNAVSPNSEIYNPNGGKKINLTVEALQIISMAVDINTLNLSIGQDGGFASGDVNVTVNTNNKTGYSLQVEDKDDDASLTSNDSTAQITSAFEGEKTALQMEDNTWGYSLVDSEYESFSKMPLLNDPTTIRTTATKSFDSTSITTFKVGIKVAASMDPGTYSDVIMFTSFANPSAQCVDEGFFCIETMQEMTPAVCAETPTPSKSATEFTYVYENTETKVPRTILRDVRDDKTYIVSKLADGHCWMSQNLELELDSTVELTEDTTDLYGREYWKPTHSTDTGDNVDWVTDYQDKGYTSHYSTSDVPQIPERSYKPASSESYLQNGVMLAGVASSENEYQAWEKVGIYYNFFAATAGSGLDGMKTLIADNYYDSDYTKRVQGSICPKGWRLPRGWLQYHDGMVDYYQFTAGDEYYNLAGIYQTENIHIMDAPLNFVQSGFVNSHYQDYYNNYEMNNISLDLRGSEGVYMENVVLNTYSPSMVVAVTGTGIGNVKLEDYDDMSSTMLSSLEYYDSSYGKYGGPLTFQGFTVRCIAR